MTGRPTKCTPDRVKRIIDALKGGNTREVAYAYAGVSRGAFYKWLARGEAQLLLDLDPDAIPESERPYVDLVEGVKRAESEAVVRNVLLVSKAAETSWQAAAWWLERRYPQDWGRKDNLHLSGGLSLSAKDQQQLDQAAEERARRELEAWEAEHS